MEKEKTFQKKNNLLSKISDNLPLRPRPHPNQPFIVQRPQLHCTPAQLNRLLRPLESQSPSDLWRYASYLGNQGLEATQPLLYFWQKILMPLTMASLVLVAAFESADRDRATALEQIRARCGFELRVADELAWLPAASRDEVATLRIFDPERAFLGRPGAGP